MKDYFKDKDNSTVNIKSEVEAIKKDIESLVQHLGNIKDNSSGALQEQLDNLNEVITNLKDKAVKSERVSLAELYSSTRKNPLRNLAYAFGMGLIVSYFIKK